MSAKDCRARQQAELQLIRDVFADEWCPLSDGEDGGVELRIPVFGGDGVLGRGGRRELHLAVRLPRSYPLPGSPPPEVSVLPSPGGWPDPPARERVRRRLAELAADLHAESDGGDRDAAAERTTAFQLLLAAPRSLGAELDSDPPPTPGGGDNGLVSEGVGEAAGKYLDAAVAAAAVSDGTTLAVMLFRFDHIKARHARRTIASLASELNLGGVLRPGKPGLVCVEGTQESVRAFEREVRRELSSCTRTMGCWGPDNHHFQSISVVGVAENDTVIGCGEGRGKIFDNFADIETETLMHAAHLFVQRGLGKLFYDGTGLDPKWRVPESVGGPDPYLKPRGGTKMKKSNKLVR